MKKGTKVWVKGHTKDLWIDDFDCIVSTYGILAEDIKKDAKKVKVRLDKIAGQYNVLCDIKLSKLKELNQETLKEIYVYGGNLIGGKVKNNILNTEIYKKDLDIKFQVQRGYYDINNAKHCDIDDIIPKLVKKLKQENVNINVNNLGFTYVVKFTPTNEGIWVLLRIIFTYLEKKYGVRQSYSDNETFHLEYNKDLIGLLRTMGLI